MAGIDDFLSNVAEGKPGDTPVAASKTTSAPIDDYLDNIAEAKPSRSKEIAASASANRSNVQAGISQGIGDVLNAGSSAIGYLDEKLTSGGADRNRLFKARIEAQNKEFENKYGDSGVASFARTAGQVVATAPFTPVRAVQGLFGAAKAGAPFLNRLGASVVGGGIAGGEFGALTSTSNDKSLARNVGEGTIGGMIAGPVVEGANAVAGKTTQAVRNLWARLKISEVASANGIEPKAAKNIIDRLADAGLTPQQAEIELHKLGPKATLADLAENLTTEAGGLAASGDKATAILKGRMNARGETANSDAVKLFESKFGSKPDVQVNSGKLAGDEADKITEAARKAVSGDYRLAHNSGDQLNISGTVHHIDKELENAVGEKAEVLKKAKSFLFRNEKSIDAEGKPVIESVLKDDVKGLHEVRQGLDDIIEKRSDSLAPRALRAVKEVRSQIDEALKTNPEMAAADIKFAEKMTVKSGLGTGYSAISKGMNSVEFGKAFDAATPETKEAIKKGMRAAIGDIMEKSSQGELTGASRLFDKKSLNRTNFKKAFGAEADDVLDALHREISFRNTERAITQNSKTAERQAVQNRYGVRSSGASSIAEGAKSALFDVVAGTPGVAAAIGGIRTGVGNRIAKFSENRLGRFIEGSADLISRSGQERDAAMSVLKRVNAIREKSKQPNIATRINSRLRLPVASGAPIGEAGYDQAKDRFDYLK